MPFVAVESINKLGVFNCVNVLNSISKKGGVDITINLTVNEYGLTNCYTNAILRDNNFWNLRHMSKFIFLYKHFLNNLNCTT